MFQSAKIAVTMHDIKSDLSWMEWKSFLYPRHDEIFISVHQLALSSDISHNVIVIAARSAIECFAFGD